MSGVIKIFVRRLAADLQSAGADVWTDEAEIKVGDSLIEKSVRSIDKSDYLAVVLSSHSVESEWVKKEVDIAMNQEIENRKLRFYQYF
ncbi:MAG: toll/interleukin-1 receptor domain-containing protein [Nitrospirales bacterium]|nr:toll/interleukin-1 receptor domain-containing protein [Nitrospirales bacterium]